MRRWSCCAAVRSTTSAWITWPPLKNRGAEISEEEKKALLTETKARYAAARLWVDALIDPAATRQVIGRSLACTTMNPHIPEFKTGVLQNVGGRKRPGPASYGILGAERRAPKCNGTRFAGTTPISGC